MDFYKSVDRLCNAFKEFMSKMVSQEHLFWCGDDDYLHHLSPKGVSYGFGTHCQLRASHFHQEGWRIFYHVDFKGKHYSHVEVALTGQHNALNSLAVFGMALSLGISEDIIQKALKNFMGVCRRCEKKGEKNGVLFIDDYAHHPTEIKATLKAIRAALPNNGSDSCISTS